MGRVVAILFFDDDPANVEAARARGWRAERIDAAGDTAAQLLDALRRHAVIGSAPPHSGGYRRR